MPYPYYVTFAPMLPGAPGQGLAGIPTQVPATTPSPAASKYPTRLTKGAVGQRRRPMSSVPLQQRLRFSGQPGTDLSNWNIARRLRGQPPIRRGRGLGQIVDAAAEAISGISAIFGSGGKNAQRDQNALTLYNGALAGSVQNAQSIYEEAAPGNPTNSPSETVTDAQHYLSLLEQQGWSVKNGTMVAPSGKAYTASAGTVAGYVAPAGLSSTSLLLIAAVVGVVLVANKS
jgi:hypothetical protein